jgi:hypothetical protein
MADRVEFKEGDTFRIGRQKFRAESKAALMAALVEAEGEAPGSRLLKVACPGACGYVARVTRKWLEALGAPLCPGCEQFMELAAPRTKKSEAA